MSLEHLAFLTVEEVIELNQDQTSRYGGAHQVRSLGLLESAMSAPEFAAYYQPEADLFWIAAHYAVHIAQNQAFQDGNKRTGVLAAAVFLRLNGHRFAPHADALPHLVALMLAVAERKAGKEEVAAFLRQHSVLL